MAKYYQEGLPGEITYFSALKSMLGPKYAVIAPVINKKNDN